MNITDHESTSTQPSGAQTRLLAGLAILLPLLLATGIILVLLRLGPATMGVEFERGLNALVNEQAEEALQYFDLAVKENPDHPEVYAYRALMRNYFGQYRQALQDYDQALDLDPDNPQHLFGRASAHHNLGQYEQAITDCDRALALVKDPVHIAQAYSGRAVSMFYQGRYDLAMESANAALHADPKCVQAYGIRGRCWEAQRHIDRARQDWQTAVRLLDENPTGPAQRRKLMRGYYGCLSGDLVNGTVLIDQAIEMSPNHPGGHLRRAEVYLKFSGPEPAIKDAQRVLELAPDNAQAQLILHEAQTLIDQRKPSQ